ncbi:MAG: hypothetical protein JW849_07375 [Phycisphaerae bacterium]|nr:hypothetical protein [Phycisphaerae bacterium]
MTRNERTIRTALRALLVLAGWMTILCLASLLRGNEPVGEARKLLDRFQQNSSATPDSAKKGDSREKFLSERNLFTGPKKPFSAKLVGVLGEWAFFENGSALKVGDDYNGAKITKIGPDWVELDVQGKTQKVQVFAGGPGSPGPSPRGMAGPPGARPSGPPPEFTLTPQMIEHFKTLPPEVREKAMQNMPPNIREQLTKALN